MKILAFTDLHGSSSAFKKLKTKAKKADIILNCGDFTIFEMEMDKILRRLNDLGKPMLIIQGNHEDGAALKRLCKKHNNLIYIDESYYIFGDLIVVAAEGNGFSITDKRFRKAALKIKRALKKYPDKHIILMTHAPPYGTRHDLIIDEHCGNKDIRKLIEDISPIYAFCGHLHENNYTKDKIGKTTTINPGPQGRLFEI